MSVVYEVEAGPFKVSYLSAGLTPKGVVDSLVLSYHDQKIHYSRNRTSALPDPDLQAFLKLARLVVLDNGLGGGPFPEEMYYYLLGVPPWRGEYVLDSPYCRMQAMFPRFEAESLDIIVTELHLRNFRLAEAEERLCITSDRCPGKPVRIEPDRGRGVVYFRLAPDDPRLPYVEAEFGSVTPAYAATSLDEVTIFIGVLAEVDASWYYLGPDGLNYLDQPRPRKD